MAGFWAKVEGGDELRRALRAVPGRFVKELESALPEEGRRLEVAANAQAPRLTGQLIASSSVTQQSSDEHVDVAVAYLDSKAAAVHEGVHHGKRVRGLRSFKWFERTLHLFEAGFVERIAARLRRLT